MHTFMKIAMPVVAALSLGMMGCIGAEVGDESEPGVAQEAVITGWSAPEQRCVLEQECALDFDLYFTEGSSVKWQASGGRFASILKEETVERWDGGMRGRVIIIVKEAPPENTSAVTLDASSDDDPMVVSFDIPYDILIDLPCDPRDPSCN